MINKPPYPMGMYTDEHKQTYRVLMLARHKENDVEYVLYQSADGERQPHFLLELDTFMAAMSDARTPAAVSFNAKEESKETAKAKKEEKSETAVIKEVKETVESAESEDTENILDLAISEYLETSDFEKRLNILAMLRHRITDDMINTLAVATDVVIEDGYIEDRFEALKKSLLIRKKYECKRV